MQLIDVWLGELLFAVQVVTEVDQKGTAETAKDDQETGRNYFKGFVNGQKI